MKKHFFKKWFSIAEVVIWITLIAFSFSWVFFFINNSLKQIWEFHKNQQIDSAYWIIQWFFSDIKNKEWRDSVWAVTQTFYYWLNNCFYVFTEEEICNLDFSSCQKTNWDTSLFSEWEVFRQVIWTENLWSSWFSPNTNFLLEKRDEWVLKHRVCVKNSWVYYNFEITFLLWEKERKKYFNILK